MGDEQASTPPDQDLAEKVASLTELVTQQQKNFSRFFENQFGTENDNLDHANAGTSTSDSQNDDDLHRMMMDINNEQDKCKKFYDVKQKKMKLELPL